MKKNRKVWFSMFIKVLLFVTIPVLASEGSFSEEKLHNIPSITSKVKIDGVLNEAVWQEALVLELKYEVEPGENIEPPVKTEALLAYGRDSLYIAFRAYDPNPSQIRARFTDRDNIENEDYVGIVLDTFNDSRVTYNFYSNPHGIQADSITSLSGGGSRWDAIWNSTGRINEEGYIVEIAIPFNSLRFQRKKDDQVWGIDVVRYYPRTLSHVIGLFPRDRSNNCYMCQASKVIGFKDVKPGKNIEIDPTLSGVLTHERESFPDGKFVKKTGKVDPGVSLRWNFTPNLTLSAAVNPDFSQVEADAAQLDINTQFALSYPEKRPFFLEGASIFSSPLSVIYTRTIADPDWGVKVTGKEGKHAIGFYSVQDNITNLLFPSSQSSASTTLNMSNISSVLRYRMDVGKSSNLGFVITDREGDDYFNRVAGIDGALRLTKKDIITFQFLGSQTCYPDEIVSEFNQPYDKFTGTAFCLNYNHETQHSLIYIIHHNIGADFRSDLGFIKQTDTIYFDGGVGRRWRHNPGHWFTTFGTGIGYVYEIDHNENLLQKSFYLVMLYEGPLQSFAQASVNFGKRNFMGMEFAENILTLSSSIRPSGTLSLGLNAGLGDKLDVANVRAGSRVNLNPFVQLNIGRHLFVELDHIFERLNVEGGRLYTANLSNFRLVYQFSRRAFLRAILQYAHFNYNPELYTFPIDPEFKHLFSQILFSYKINPRTVLFLGYSDDYYGDHAIPLKQNNRTLFLKIGYALVL